MADFSVVAKLTADSSAFTRGVGEAKSALGNLQSGASQAMQNVGSAMTTAGKGMTAAVTAPILGIGAAAVKLGVGFDDSMRRVQAISGATGEELVDLESIAREMGATTRYSASEAANGLEYMALAGWETEQMMSALPAVLNLAASGGMDLARASDIVTDTMSMFGMEATEASRAADIFAAAQSKSNTNTEQLGEALVKAGPAAASAGESLESTSAILGILANNGIKGSKAGTMVSAMYRDLRASAEDGAVAIGDSAVAIYDATGEMRPMIDIIADIEDATEGMTDAQRDAALAGILQQQSLDGLLPLLGAGTESIYELEEALENSNGTAAEMAKIMEGGLGGAFRSLKSALEEAALSIFKVLEPAIRSIGERVQEAVNWFNSLDEATRENIVRWALVAAAIGPVLIILGTLISSIGKIIMAFKILGAVFAFLTSPIGLLIAAIMAIVGVIIYLWNTNEAFRTAITEIWNDIVETAIMLWNQLKSAAETIWGAIQETWQAVWENIQILWDGFKGLFEGDWSAFWETIRSVGEGIWNALTGIWNAVLGTIIAVFGFFKGLFTGDWSTFWEGISQLADGVWQALSGLWQSFTGKLQAVWEGAKALLGGDWQGFWESIKTVASGIWDNLKELWNQVKTNVSETWNGIKDSMSDWGAHWETLKTTAQEIWNAIVEAIRTWFTNITSAITEAMPGVTEAWGAIWEGFTEVAQAIWDGIVESVGGFMGNIRDKIAEIGEGIAEAWNGFWGGIGEKATETWTGISDGWNNFWGNTAETTNTGSAQVTSAVAGMSGQVVSSTDAMSTGAQSSVSGMNSAVVGEVAGMATSVMTESQQIESAKRFFENLRIASVGAFSVMGSQINLSYSNTKQSIVSISTSMESETTAKYKSLANNIKSNMQDIQSNTSSSMNTIKSTWTSGMMSFTSMTTSSMNGATSTIRSAMSNSVSAMRSAAGQARSAGANMGYGFQSGLASTAGSIYATARNIANNAANIMRSALRIKSPSRVTEEIGSYTGEGFVVGLENMIRPASKAAKNLALSGIPDIDSNSITGELNRLTGGNLNAGYTFNGGTLSINQQPATIHLNMGGHEWSAFTNDISQTQQAELRLENY